MLWTACVLVGHLGTTGVRRPPPVMAATAGPPNTPRRLRVAVVGDVHGQWDEGDASALRGLRPAIDLCLFVGDFGDEDVTSVEAVARASLPGEQVSVFGNHDAWFSLDKRKRRPNKSARARNGDESALDTQRALLSGLNLEYSKRELPQLGLSVVGGRPYSIGGPIWPPFYVEEYGLTSVVESGDRIGRIAARAAESSVIFLAHNGPAGLGDKRSDVCGRDWPQRTGKNVGASGGDWGDRDLTVAIRMAREAGKKVPLVAFGHLHRRLIGGGLRTMVRVDEGTGTVFLNAAEVPRWRGPGVEPLPYDAAEASAEAAARLAGGTGAAAKAREDRARLLERKQHWFAIVEMASSEEGVISVDKVSGCWVESDGTVCEEEEWFTRRAPPAGRQAAAGSAAQPAQTQQMARPMHKHPPQQLRSTMPQASATVTGSRRQ